MPFALDHIHLRAPEPDTTAQWYIEYFGARVLSEGSANGVRTISLDLDGLRLNVTSGREGQHLEEGSADLHYGLEHFGLRTEHLDRMVEQLERQGVEILAPVTAAPSGLKIAFIRAPDNVRIELMERPTTA